MVVELKPLPRGWRWAPLGEVLAQRNDVVHPKDGPIGSARFVGLEHVQSGTGQRIGETFVDLAKMPGRRARFRAGDIVYGYLRPYLNKVWIAEFEGLCSVDQYVYIVNHEIADTEFVAAYLRSGDYLSLAPIKETPGQLPRVRTDEVAATPIPLPEISEQRRIVAALNEHRAVLTAARVKADECASDVRRLLNVELAEALGAASRICTLGECLTEIKAGVGQEWARYPVLGATREGVAPAKEPVGKTPERYKLARAGTIFYNPMRILIGSIALVDDDTTEGIVSPDYVVAKPNLDKLLPRFLYYWLRSQYGASAILDSARGAVRERMMFKGLAKIELPLPDIERQLHFDRIYIASRIVCLRLIEQQKELAALETALLRAAFSGAL